MSTLMSRQLHSRDRVTINCCKKQEEDTFLAKNYKLQKKGQAFWKSWLLSIVHTKYDSFGFYMVDILSENGFIDRSMFTQWKEFNPL